jgi:hypothetical protein
MWQFAVEYTCTPDKVLEQDEAMERIAGCKAWATFNSPDAPLGRRSIFKARSDRSFLNKLRRFAKKKITIIYVYTK